MIYLETSQRCCGNLYGLSNNQFAYLARLGSTNMLYLSLNYVHVCIDTYRDRHHYCL